MGVSDQPLNNARPEQEALDSGNKEEAAGPADQLVEVPRHRLRVSGSGDQYQPSHARSVRPLAASQRQGEAAAQRVADEDDLLHAQTAHELPQVGRLHR